MLEAWGFSPGFINVIQGLYFMVVIVGDDTTSCMFLHWVTTGVLQGCPLSGSLFAISADPIAHAFGRLDLRGSSCTCLCADVMGTALLNFLPLKSFAFIFKVFKPLTGLALNPRKLVFVILGDVFAGIKDWLLR